MKETQFRLVAPVEGGDVQYAEERPTASEVIALFQASGLAGPWDQPKRVQRMIDEAQCVLTARAEGRLVGLVRVLTDYVHTATVADLAVRSEVECLGIGSELLGRATAAFPGVKFIAQTGWQTDRFFLTNGFAPAVGMVLTRTQTRYEQLSEGRPRVVTAADPTGRPDRDVQALPASAPPRPRFRLSLIGGFGLTADGRSEQLFTNGQRLIAFLALQARTVPRSFVAGTLWPEVSEQRAAGNLRSEVWRLRRRGLTIVEGRPGGLRLSPEIVVDVLEAERAARRILDGADVPADGGVDALVFDTGELLPGWYVDWVVTERERHRLLRLQALRVLCERLIDAARFGGAVLAANGAVSCEPLDEQAQRLLVRAYLAAGNKAEAIRRYRVYEQLLAREFGLQPSAEMQQLIADIA